MTRTTPELPPLLQASEPHQREDVWRATGPIHDGSSVESGLEPGSPWSRGRDFTTRPPKTLGQRNLANSCLIR
ncbi:hypothetical protein AVEN_110925-1 [Araneus ventricosus]|uniref:Uncharacterized protein n=1 Tax=Araneus ventricosus TaxID=182803 RepID=A0A4Y2L588_ARAVE|nr:hypothetical protein AVEN_110925-1 [Araneus ventricosus]